MKRKLRRNSEREKQKEENEISELEVRKGGREADRWRGENIEAEREGEKEEMGEGEC